MSQNLHFPHQLKPVFSRGDFSHHEEALPKKVKPSSSLRGTSPVRRAQQAPVWEDTAVSSTAESGWQGGSEPDSVSRAALWNWQLSFSVKSRTESTEHISGTSYRLAKHPMKTHENQCTDDLFLFSLKLYLNKTSEDFLFLTISHL